MSTSQDSVQLDQHFDILSSCPLVISEDASSSFPQQEPTERQCPAHSSFSPTRATEKSSEQDVREPLKEVTKGKKGNQETAEQEQQDTDEKEESSSGDNGDKLNDYVTKVLDKLAKHRNKVAKLNSSLEKRGSAGKRRAAQEADEVHSDDSDSGEEDHSNDAEDNDNSKENLSPVKAKHSVPQETRQVLSNITQKTAAVQSFKIEDVLQISKTSIHYGSRFPGQVAEEHFEIVNKSGHDFVVQIIVSCLNEELKDTDEYVYSVRRSHLYDYNDKHYLIMAPYSCAAFKFALKVPNMKLSGTIMGQVEVSIQGGSGNYTLDLSADVSVPKVFCPKELRCNGLDYKVIKLAIKEGKKQDIKIPIRNNGDVPVTLDLEFFEPKDGSQDSSMVDCLVHPNSVTIPANGLALTSILVKPVKSMGKTKLEKGKPVRKIMVGRVRDSALVYSFVFWIELY